MRIGKTQILQSLALAVLKLPYAGYLLSGNRSKIIMVITIYGFILALKIINIIRFVDTLSRRTFFWVTGVPCGSKNSHNVVQLNPDEDKYYLLTPYPTLMQSLKKFSPESIRAIARNPNIDLQSIGIYSKSGYQWIPYNDNQLIKI